VPTRGQRFASVSLRYRSSDTPGPPQAIVFGKDRLDVGARPLVAPALGN